MAGATQNGEPTDDPGARRLLLLAVAGGFLVRLAFSLLDDGLFWPDEFYQSLEPAHRLVFGYGWVAWEFVDGARHWTLPGFVAALLWFANALHLPLIGFVRLVCVLINTASIGGVYFLARSLGASARSSALAALVFACMGFAVYVSPRTMGETLSVLPLTLALALCFQPTVRKMVLAGALLSITVGLRLHHGFFAIGAMAIVFNSRDRKSLLALTVSLGTGAIVYGLVDALTWGSPFQSAIKYVDFNLVQGRASDFGIAPWWKFAAALVTSEGVTFIPVLLLSMAGARRSALLPLIAVGFVVLHSFVPHKELRFVFATLPLLTAHAALGLDRARPWVRAAVVLCAVVSLSTLPWLTFGRLGLNDPPRETSALDFGGPENRLLLVAGRRDDVCGLRIADFPNWRTGGYAWFHRNAPLYRAEKPGQGVGHFNYVIARRGSFEGVEVAVDHDIALVRVAESCAPDPAYDWRLE